jgi:hypothetical protein
MGEAFKMSLGKMIRHPLSPLAMRTLWALIAIFVIMIVGTVGIKELTGWHWVQSFYFMAMLATAEGPPETPPGIAASIFAAVMAFVSIGTLITAAGVIFGPYLGYLFHKGMAFSEKEFQKLEAERKGKMAGQENEGK